MRTLPIRLLAAALLLVLPACGALAPGPSPASGPLARRTVITAEEIAALRLPDLHAVVRTLHPEWLGGAVRVHVGGEARGGAEVLAGLPASGPVQVRFLGPGEAARELGGTDGAGVIVVEEGRFAVQRDPPRLPVHGTVVVSGLNTFSALGHPMEGNAGFTLRSESREGDAGWMVAGRLSVAGVYVQPFYVRAQRRHSAVYDHPSQTRNVSRVVEPRLGLIAGYDFGPVRAGVGWIAERVESHWSAGECACYQQGFDERVHSLPVAEIAARVPLAGRFSAELRVSGRIRPDAAEYIPEYHPASFIRDGGTDYDVALGIGTRLF